MDSDEWFAQHQRKICESKRPYSCKSAAKKAVKHLKKVRGKGFKRMDVYECSVCEKWHLTTKRKR